MIFTNCDEYASAFSGDSVLSGDRALGNRFACTRFYNPGSQLQELDSGSWLAQLDFVLSGNSAGWSLQTVFYHQMVTGHPVAVTVQQRSDNATVEYTGECLVIGLRSEGRSELIAVYKTLQLKALRIRWSTSKTDQVWGKLVLKTCAKIYHHFQPFQRKSVFRVAFLNIGTA